VYSAWAHAVGGWRVGREREGERVRVGFAENAGSSTPSGTSVAPSRCFATSAAAPIAWPSATPASSPWTTGRLLQAGQRVSATHQVEATVDFAPHDRILTWFIGGLNFQIEHHLFPRVCHTHYPALSKMVERVRLKHGVRYATHPSATAALRSHYRWLRKLGRA
jgi:fatty acid desaturase